MSQTIEQVRGYYEEYKRAYKEARTRPGSLETVVRDPNGKLSTIRTLNGSAYRKRIIELQMKEPPSKSYSSTTFDNDGNKTTREVNIWEIQN